MKRNTFLLMIVAICSSPVWATRYLSGSADVQNQELKENINTQRIQTNEQKASGQISSSQANNLNNQISNLNLHQREIQGQVAANGEVAVNPPSVFYNLAEQEQANLQTNAIDQQLNSAGVTAHSPQQEVKSQSFPSYPTSSSSRSTSANTSDSKAYGP